MRYKLLTSILLGSCLLSNVYADAGTGFVSRIFIQGATVNFKLKDDTCVTGSQYYLFRMNDADETRQYAAKNWYALLLASAMASKPITVNVASCPGEGESRAVVKYIFQDY